MKSLFLFTCFLATIFASNRDVVTTTLPPYAYAIEKISGGTIEVQILIPENSNPHTFEARPQDIKKLNQSSLWFCSGEYLESKLAASSKIKRVNLNQNLILLHDQDCHHSHHHSHHHDLHTWLSPENYFLQSKIIFNSLVESFPEKKIIFEKNFKDLEAEIQELIAKTKMAARCRHTSQMVVSHPAYGYLCKDIGMTQVSLEQDGKEASLKHIQKIYSDLKEAHIDHVFAEIQHGDLGAKRIAELFKAKIIYVNPYQKDYPKAISEILDTIQ